MASAPTAERYGAAHAVVTTVLEVLPETEYVLSSDPSWLRGLIAGYNAAYETGFKFLLFVLAAVSIVAAPFIGMFAAGWSFLASFARTAAIWVGRFVADELGYGEYVRTRAAYLLWQRQKAHRTGAVTLRLPTMGVRASSRYPALAEDEFMGVNADFSGLRPLIRAFNAAFSVGFAAGTVLCAVLTLILAPFIGMFIAGGSFLIALIRTFSRSDGRLLTDLMGVSALVEQSVAQMQEEMGVENLHATEATHITSGGHPRPGGGGGAAAAAAAAGGQRFAQPLLMNGYGAPAATLAPGGAVAVVAGPGHQQAYAPTGVVGYQLQQGGPVTYMVAAQPQQAPPGYAPAAALPVASAVQVPVYGGAAAAAAVPGGAAVPSAAAAGATAPSSMISEDPTFTPMKQ